MIIGLQRLHSDAMLSLAVNDVPYPLVGQVKPDKPSTLAGYTQQLEMVYFIIGGLAINQILPLHLKELRRRTTKTGQPVCEATVQKYLDTVSAVLEDAKRNDILLYNLAH